MLVRGAAAPAFALAATGPQSPLLLARFAGRRLVLIFLPSAPSDDLIATLVRYAGAGSQFADQSADVAAISALPIEELRALADRHGLDFPLLSDPRQDTATAYQVRSSDGQIRPTVYLVDEEGMVAAAFDPERYPNLPAPAAVVRALRRLNDVLRPAPPSADDWRLGPADAPVTLIEYSDYQCPHCRALHGLLERLKEAYGTKLSVIHRHLPLRHTHPMAQLAAEAAEAAGAQGRFWPMHQRLFAAGDELTRERVLAIAADLGLDMERFVADLDGRVYEPAVNEDFKRAVAAGIKLPPTLFINGVLFEGPRTEQGLREHIEALLATPSA